MSGRRRKKADRKKRSGAWHQTGWLTGLLLVTIALYLGLSLTGSTGAWWGYIDGESPREFSTQGNPGGPVGAFTDLVLRLVFGNLWCWFVPLCMLVVGAGQVVGRTVAPRRFVLRALPLWLASAAWLAQPDGPLGTVTGLRLGGGIGHYTARGFQALLGVGGTLIVLSAVVLVVAGLVFRRPLKALLDTLGRAGGLLSGPAAAVRALLDDLADRRDEWREGREERRREREAEAEAAARDSGPEPEPEREPAPRERVVHEIPAPEDAPEPPPAAGDAETLNLPGAAGDPYAEDADGERPAPRKPRKVKRKRGPVALPGLDLLTPAGPEGQAVSATDLDSAADLLEATLRSFGVEGEVKDVRPGPVVTTFEYQPGTGIRVSQIVQRSDDLALAMRARSIRMEAPIPGKAAVGIEIPNPTARMVRLREVLELTGEQGGGPLTVVLGKDVVGRPVSIDIASLPHLLVAGSTGSGKSVCLNAVISNLLLRNDPSRLRLCLIDPKMLEMNVYNGIPHLLLPVVTDPREALKALQWMVAQMELRYRQLAKWSVRNIQQYNDKIERGEVTDENGDRVEEPMPYFLTIVDELADLMLQLGNDFEGPITRLAQKARAVGIHLILATQRPSVDVLTGVIKANIPCRIAFRVIQKNDSRTILDMNGAEQLLGHGDMLYLQPGRALPVRVHGSFIDVDECEAVAAHWRAYEGTTEEIDLSGGAGGGGDYTGEDDLFEDAKKVVVLHQSGSTSLLQRRLRIGYTRAGRLMDMLEEAGVVGPFTGSKARDVLIKPEELEGEG